MFLRLDMNARGYAYTSLRAGDVPPREQQVAIWAVP
jgi:hypothetical protein